MPPHRLLKEGFAVQSRLPLRSSRRGGCGRRFASAVRALFAPRVPLRAARGRPPPHALLGRLRLPAAASLAAPFLAPARCRGVPLLSASGGGRLRWRFAAPALGLGWGGGAQAAAHRATQASRRRSCRRACMPLARAGPLPLVSAFGLWSLRLWGSVGVGRLL